MDTIIFKSFIQGIIFALIGGATLWILCTIGIVGQANSFPEVPADKWQAVFLEGGQVYFGRMQENGGDYVTLSNVYYLKEASDLTQSNLNLVKLGGELHGPEDTIHIRKESISFWENMKDTSRVVQSIADSQ